jgi:hypothetical protein
MKMYHATKMSNMDSIFEKGILRGSNGVVYLTTKPEDAAKFVAIRGEKEILVVKVEIPKAKLVESYDHSESFFGCKAYTYAGDIPRIKIDSFIKFEF